VLVEHGTLFGELPAGGFDRIAAAPDGGAAAGERESEKSLDDAALETGTD
jgi:argininosuccinate synthase